MKYLNKLSVSVSKSMLPYKKTVFVLLALLIISCNLSAQGKMTLIFKGRYDSEVLCRIVAID